MNKLGQVRTWLRQEEGTAGFVLIPETQSPVVSEMPFDVTWVELAINKVRDEYDIMYNFKKKYVANIKIKLRKCP